MHDKEDRGACIIPYLNDREYMRIRDVGTFIRWRDVLVIIMEE